MNLKLRKIYITVNLWRVIPVCCCMKLSKFRDKIKEDLDVWKREDGNLEGKIYSTGEILLYDKAFINLLLNRLHRDPLLWVVTRIFFSPRDSLEINMPPEKIGGGGCIFNMALLLLLQPKK